MGLFSLYKPKEYKYRYIYYDPKKETRDAREKELQAQEQAKADGTYRPTIRRGTFREMANKNKSNRTEQIRQANVRLLIIMVLLVLLFYFLIR
jgi:hypothetical protein